MRSTLTRHALALLFVGVGAAGACTVEDKGDYTFSDNPEGGGTGGKGGGAGKGGKGGSGGRGGTDTTAGESGTDNTGGSGATGGRTASGGRGGGTGGSSKGGTTSSGGNAGENAGETGAGEAGIGQGGAGTGGTAGGGSGTSGSSGMGGTAGSNGSCGNNTVDTGENCDDGNAITETCQYGQTSCTICDSTCHRGPGATAYCGDRTTQSAGGERCDDGNTVTEPCPYGTTTCGCDATCQPIPPRFCGNNRIDGATVTGLVLQYLASDCDYGLDFPVFLNGVQIATVPSAECVCVGNTVRTVTITNSAALAALRPGGNVLDLQVGPSGAVGWARLTAQLDGASGQTFLPIDLGVGANSSPDLCNSSGTALYFQRGMTMSAPFGMGMPIEQCDGGMSCTGCGRDYRAYSGYFMRGQAAPPEECAKWRTFQNGLSGTYNHMHLFGTFNQVGLTCDDAGAVAQFASAMLTNTPILMNCNGHQWSLCNRNNGEIWIDAPTSCPVNACPNPGYVVRPCDQNNLWGGIGSAICGAPEQSMAMEFF